MIVWAGSILGVILGLAHGAYVFGKISRPVAGSTSPDYLRGLYYAAWVVLLWIVFGAYVLVLWVAGLLAYAVFGRMR